MVLDEILFEVLEEQALFLHELWVVLQIKQMLEMLTVFLFEVSYLGLPNVLLLHLRPVIEVDTYRLITQNVA